MDFEFELEKFELLGEPLVRVTEGEQNNEEIVFHFSKYNKTNKEYKFIGGFHKFNKQSKDHLLNEIARLFF